jgi:hypothetical protein
VTESQRKTKSKITWRKQLWDPLGKGNGSTHPRQNYAQAKSANHQTKARKTHKKHTCKLPLNQCNSPWMNACKTPLETGQLQQLSPKPFRPVNTTTSQTGVQHVNRTSCWRKISTSRPAHSKPNKAVLTHVAKSESCQSIFLKLTKAEKQLDKTWNLPVGTIQFRIYGLKAHQNDI